MQRRKRSDTHRHWKCPKCKAEFHNPIPCSLVVCPSQYHGSRREPVAMVPIKEET